MWAVICDRAQGEVGCVDRSSEGEKLAGEVDDAAKIRFISMKVQQVFRIG
jgi:hypothetical protein